MRILAAIVLISVGIPTHGDAQDSPWEAFDPSHPNFVSIGGGATSGFLGVRYSRSLGSSPALIGIGVGLDGITPYVEIARAKGRLEDLQAYFGLGFWIGWGDQSHTGFLVLDFGHRRWLGQKWRWYVDYGASIVPPLWGETHLGLLTFAYPRLQMGVTF